MFHHTYAFVCFANIPPFCAGELPKELGNLVNLTTLYLFNNEFRGELYVLSYMCLCVLLTFHPFEQVNCPRSSATSSI